MTNDPVEQPEPTETDEDDENLGGKGGGDGKSKALGTPGLGDRGRTNANEPRDD